MPSSSAETLDRALSDGAWAQWASLGVSSGTRQRESRCIDPEALIWLTFASGADVDARLVDAARDWLRLNRNLVSAHRLRNMFGGDKTSLQKVMSAQIDDAKSARIKTAVKAVDPDPMLPANLAIRLRLLMDAGSRSEVARFLLTWPGTGADAQHVAAAAAFAKRNVNDILLSFVRGGVVREAWAGNRREFSADKDRWCVFLGMLSEDLPGYMPWMALFRAASRILGWYEAQRSSDVSAYLRSSSARDLVEEVRSDLASCGIEVPDPGRFSGEAFLEPLDAMVEEVGKMVAPQGV